MPVCNRLLIDKCKLSSLHHFTVVGPGWVYLIVAFIAYSSLVSRTQDTITQVICYACVLNLYLLIILHLAKCADLHYSINIKSSGYQCEYSRTLHPWICLKSMLLPLLHSCHLQRPRSCPLIIQPHPPLCRMGSSPPCPDILLFSTDLAQTVW